MNDSRKIFWHHQPLYLAVSFLAVALVAFGVSFWWHATQSVSLLPAAVTKQITSFTPYFYKGSIPGGYTLSATPSFSHGVLFVSLARPGSPPLSITEQAKPANQTEDDLFASGERIEGTAGRASINSVEDRIIGVMVSLDGKTLVMVSSAGEIGKEEVAQLLRGLTALEP